MVIFQVPEQLADQLGKETTHLLDNNIAVWKLLTGMFNYSDYKDFDGFQHSQLIKKRPTCLFDPVYYYTRDYSKHGTFENMFANNKPNIPSIAALVNHLRDTYLDQTYDLFRLYVNLLPKGPKAIFPPHVDMLGDNNYTFLYYIIDSDGDTLIFDSNTKQVINSTTPRKGTGIYFPSSTIHAASTPVEHEIRIVANVIFSKRFYNKDV